MLELRYGGKRARCTGPRAKTRHSTGQKGAKMAPPTSWPNSKGQKQRHGGSVGLGSIREGALESIICRDRLRPVSVVLWYSGQNCIRTHIRMVIRTTLLTTERLFWRCADHSANSVSAYRGRFLMTKICCFRWHVDLPLHLFIFFKPCGARVNPREGLNPKAGFTRVGSPAKTSDRSRT